MLAVGLVLTEATGLTRLTAGLFPPAPPGPMQPAAPAVAPVAEKEPAPLVVPFDAEQARAGQEAWAKRLGRPSKSRTSVGMKLRLIPPGEFFMTPQYRVRISKPFRLERVRDDRGPVPRLRGGNQIQDGRGGLGRGRDWSGTATARDDQKPEYTWRHPDVAQGDDYPVGQLSWHDADKFCQWLSGKEHRTYRLPTEAEWEWACRAGSEGAYCFGDDAKELGDYAWYDENSDWKSHPVGQKKPNAWGLYDMHGNIAEYCQDWSADLPTGVRTDPKRAGAGRLSGHPQLRFHRLRRRAAIGQPCEPPAPRFDVSFRLPGAVRASRFSAA